MSVLCLQNIYQQAMSCNQMMRVQFCCRRWTGGEAEYELVKKVDLERELDEHEVERMVDEDRVMVLIVLISIG